MDSWTKDEKLFCAAGSYHRDFGPFKGDDPQKDFADDWSTAFSPLVRMLFAPEQDPQAAVPSIDDLSLSQSFPCWDQQPWSHPESQWATQPCSQTPALDLLGASEGSHSGRMCAFMAHESESAHPPEHFSKLVALFRFNSVLHSGSSSPGNSENSVISSGYHHLVFGRVSPPLPPILPRMRAEGVKLETDTHLEQNLNSFMSAPSARAEGSVYGYQSTGSIWDNLGLNKCLERQAKLHKQAAAVNKATCTWEGCLPPRRYKDPVYSCKVFLGGLPWDIVEAQLLKTFSVFGPLNVEWPGKDGSRQGFPGLGYVYLLFDSEKSVKTLLEGCTRYHLQSDDYLEFYYKLSSKRVYNKDVQVIPWVISDTSFIHSPSERHYYRNTVFVGALHGLLNAEGLAHIMDELFGGVVCAEIFADKHKYPVGSGRVTFRDQSSYLKAVTAAFVLIKTSTFMKKIQIDPYLCDSMCQTCYSQPGLYFCRAKVCFKYYCWSCWHWRHSLGKFRNHQALMLNRKRPEPQL